MDTSTKLTPKEIRSQLAQFTGTVNWYAFPYPFSGFKFTDGIHFVAEECGAYWMLDIVASYQLHDKVGGQRFQVYKFVKHEDSSCTLTIEDGNNNVLMTQEISFTDFPLDEITLWFINDTLLLPSEY